MIVVKFCDIVVISHDELSFVLKLSLIFEMFWDEVLDLELCGSIEILRMLDLIYCHVVLDTSIDENREGLYCDIYVDTSVFEDREGIGVDWYV